MKAFSHISDVQFCDCVNSPYIKPRRMLYKENGMSRCWDFIESLDSVAVVLYHRDKDSLLFVKQFRPPLFARNPNTHQAYTCELCAGLVDKAGKSLEQIAKEEVLEECGYKVDSLTYITTFATAVGHSGAKQHLFYACIDEEQKISAGGGVDGEVIETLLIEVANLKSFVFDECIIKTPGLGFGVLWFLQHYPELKDRANINKEA